MIPFTLRQLVHTVLRVRDLEASLQFYRDVLGCSLDKVQYGIGLKPIHAGPPLIDLVPLDGVFVETGARGLSTRIEPVRVGGRLKQSLPVLTS